MKKFATWNVNSLSVRLPQLLDWLEPYTFPAESRHADPVVVEAPKLVALVEQLRVERAEARPDHEIAVPEQRREPLHLRRGARGDDHAHPRLLPGAHAAHELPVLADQCDRHLATLEVQQHLRGSTLRLVLEASADRAIVRGRPIAIEFLPDGYRFSALDPDDNWRPLIDPPVFNERALPSGLGWAGLRLDGQPDASVPRLQFGTQAPEYELRVATPNGEARFTGKANGEVILDMPGTPRS